MTQSQRDLKAFMAVMQAAAIADAKLMPTTPDIKRRAHALVAFARDRVAEMRDERPSNVAGRAVRAAMLAMSPAQVSARLAELRAAYPTLQFPHDDYEHMTDEDLRSALEDVEALIQRGG